VRVLHVLDVSLPVVAGYTTRSRSILHAQRALGLDPVVLTSARQPGDGGEMEEIEGIRHYRTPLARAARRQPLLEMAALRRRIVEVARREDVDVIHAHSPVLCGAPAWLAARQLGRPCVYEIRAFWEDAAVTSGTAREGGLKYRAVRAAETALARRVDGLVGICAGIRDDLLRRGIPAERVHVVPNGVDVGAFAPAPPDEGVRARYGLGGRTVVAYIGTLFPFEGVDDLVRALARLVRDEGRDDVRGVIVGQGPADAACRAATEAAGLAGRMLHLGRVPHHEVQALYSVADVLVYPRRPGRLTDLVTPLKPLEAMAMAKAVVASDVGGLRELVEDGVTGLLHRPSDVAHLASTVRRLVDAPLLRDSLGRQARAFVEEQRQWRTLVARHLDVYDRARARRAGGLEPMGVMP
jgi:PEP-CTERM/exosortase A-associated glycosyltransferase